MLTSLDLDAEPTSVNRNACDIFADSLLVECFGEPSTFTSEDASPKGTDEEPHLKKRKLSTTKENDENEIKEEELEVELLQGLEVLEVELNQGLEIAEESARSQRKERFLGLRLPERLYPKSAYEEDESTTSVVEEKIVIQNILVCSLG